MGVFFLKLWSIYCDLKMDIRDTVMVEGCASEVNWVLVVVVRTFKCLWGGCHSGVIR